MQNNETSKFVVTVKNGLFEDKHRIAMGEAWWLYGWYLDRVTKIEDGKGFVYGGAPVSFEQVQEKYPSMKRLSYQRYLDRLRDAGYITTQKTARGIIVKVTKAKKVFGDVSKKIQHTQSDVSNSIQQEASDVSFLNNDVSNTIQRGIKNDTSKRQDNRQYNRQVSKRAEVEFSADQEAKFDTILTSYRAISGSSKNKIGDTTKRNILKTLENGHSPERIVEAIKNQHRAKKEFIRGLSFDQLFQQSNKGGDCDYIDDILTSYNFS